MVKVKQPTIEELSDLTGKILEHVSHTNEITRILDVITENSSSDILVVAAIASLRKIYDKFLTNSWMFEVSGESGEVLEYRVWMRETYDDVFSSVSTKITSSSGQIQESAYSTILAFLQAETVFIKLSRDRTSIFIEHVLTSKSSDFVTRLSQEISDLDWKYAALRGIERFSKKHASEKDVNLAPLVYQLLSSIDISEFSSQGHEEKKRKTDASKTIFHICKAFNSTWIQFLKMPKSRELYHEILTNLHEQVIPHMQNPKLLIDFLVDSYDLGGTSALLALNSLFILITQYNLDYPSFYPKLYRMLTPDLLHTPYVPRFMAMLDMFLKSPLLPAYLVAAFAKRLAHHALQAPPPVIIIVLRLITNLMKLHPSVKRLVHRGPDHPAVRADPFQPDTDDPAECAALDSSLWELEVLAEHCCPAVPTVAKTLRKPTDEILVDLGLTRGHDVIFKEYMKMWKKDPPLEFNEPLTFDQSEYADVFTF